MLEETPHHNTPCQNDVIKDIMEVLQTAPFRITNGVLAPLSNESLATVAHQRELADKRKARERAAAAAAVEASAATRVLKKGPFNKYYKRSTVSTGDSRAIRLAKNVIF